MNSPTFGPFIAVIATISALQGCSLAPNYQRPATPMANAWPTGAAYAEANKVSTTGLAAADIGWAEFFTDPYLCKLIALALDNNPDLRIAALNVEQARAQYQIQQAEQFPSIAAAGSATRQRTSEALRMPGAAAVGSQYSTSLGFTAFELDLFGRVRSLKDAALAQYLANKEAHTSAQISLVAEVANAYLNERALAAKLTVAEQTLVAQQASYNLTKRSYAAGIVSALDLTTAQTQIAAAQVNADSLRQQQAQALNALTLLLGQPLPAELPPVPSFTDQHLLANLPLGLPSDLLLRRPDIREAEEQLKAANANIGAARAAFFPSISLTGSVGSASNQLEDLFKAGTRTWNFIPQLTVPIFSAGKNKANLEVAEVKKHIAVVRYEKAIQTAFKEVADALTARAMLTRQLKTQADLVQAQQTRHRLAEQRYRSGIDSYLALLDAQRELYSAQQSFIQTRLAELVNRVNLYKALGGGWSKATLTAKDQKLPK